MQIWAFGASGFAAGMFSPGDPAQADHNRRRFAAAQAGRAFGWPERKCPVFADPVTFTSPARRSAGLPNAWPCA
jgi:hypothetical protein